MNHSTNGRNTSSRGFVLSFAIFVVALLVLVHAQLQANQLYALRFSGASAWQETHPFRLADDAGMDLNTLLDQRVQLDQNADTVFLTLQGALPSPLSMSQNLQRYQSSLQSLGTLSHESVFLDLNSTLNDGNVVGQTNTGLRWKKNLATNKLLIFPTNIFSRPRRIDVNLYVDHAYATASASGLSGSGDMFVSLFYSDSNTAHDSNVSGWMNYTQTKVYSGTYSNGASAFSLRLGLVDGNNASISIDNNNTANLSVTYSIRVLLDANTTPTRVGYAFPLTIVGSDANVVEEWQYVDE